MSLDNNAESNMSEKISSRNNLLKIFVVVVFTVIFGVKLWESNLSNVFNAFSFNDLLSLIMALFAIWLSILFYTKASETANTFYDNTYKFTKDISVMLGRIEAGFGEKLDHLDKGYSDINSTVQNYYNEKRETQKSLEKEEDVVQQVSEEQTELFRDLAQRAELKDKEKQELFDRLEEQQRELNSAQERASIFENLAQRAQLQEEEKTQILKRLEEHGQLLKMAQERGAMFENLAQRAQLEGEEKRRLFKRLEEQNAELDAARKEIKFLKSKSTGADNTVIRSAQNRFLNVILPHLSRRVNANSTDDSLNHEIKLLLADRADDFLDGFRRAGLIDNDGNLSMQALDLVRLFLEKRTKVRHVLV